MKNYLPALTIFLGSFLIFGVQPMLGRALLPAFGGTAAVWTVCLCAYQMLLLAGYFYAHVVSNEGRAVLSEHAVETDGAVGRRRPAACRRNMHIALLTLAVAWVTTFAYFRPWLMAQVGNGAYPALEVLFCVLAFVGLPYILLSANSTLIQAWVSQRADVGRATRDMENKQPPMSHVPRPTSDVYRLYAVSNAGSLAGLLCYPFLVEPYLSLDVQWYGFAGCLAAYVCLLARLAQVDVTDGTNRTHETQGTDRMDRTDRVKVLWLMLPATSTFLLNAVTTHLCTDVTPIPLFWVVLLSAFLLSYIIGFSRFGEKGVSAWCFATLLPLLGCAYTTRMPGGQGYLQNLGSGLSFVLLGCTFLHSWLYRIRPVTGQLTTYYLCIAAGGAIGGLLSGIVAPLVFSRVLEYPVILLLMAGLVSYYLLRQPWTGLKRVGWLCQIVVLAVCYFGLSAVFTGEQGILLRSRNFYGCLTVKQIPVTSQSGDTSLVNCFLHGDTLHGVQYQSPCWRDEPTTYFGLYAGGFSVVSHPYYTNGTPLSVGVVGLGIGTMACWGRTNDTYRFFEINPAVVKVAQNTNLFTYLSSSQADVSIALGDARQTLTTETNTYDVLVIDAYSGDAIPYHLATREAFQLYFKRLNTNGILAVHISNWHIDLNPLCKAVGEQWKIPCFGLQAEQNGIGSPATWAYLTHQPIAMPKTAACRETDWTQVRTLALPSDAKGSLISLVSYGHVSPQKPE